MITLTRTTLLVFPANEDQIILVSYQKSESKVELHPIFKLKRNLSRNPTLFTSFFSQICIANENSIVVK